MVPGSAPALGCRRVRLAPDLSKQPPACGRIFFNSAREGACWCTRGRVRSPGPRRCRAIFCGAAASIPVAELGTSFDGGWRGLASCSRNSKCRAFRVGRAHSISRRVRMSDAMDSQISGVHKKLGHLFKSGGMHFLLERVACRTMANHGERSKLKHIKVSFYDGLPPQAHSGRDGPKKKWPVNRRYV